MDVIRLIGLCGTDLDELQGRPRAVKKQKAGQKQKGMLTLCVSSKYFWQAS